MGSFSKGAHRLLESKRWITGWCYLLTTTALLWFGKIPPEVWQLATMPVMATLIAAQTWEDVRKPEP